ncbi:Na+/H+ antiporter [Herminiimonas fonticola]|uniref:Sodium/proton antiporter (CPA1 family) n=1 Tax=Herminiimonas fonticola TaxID=303380 RepID=A0A4R6G6N3_9BURK|nr:Na+/H+ antiporter [Herminiimonas fonticola]RBA24220.1 Na+/H+ antiporter [Herminiimonas fonticola]TDN90221.1 sodium/proton antiporter (CPA1 family) [Herminiimonas fonticola]
MHTVTIALVLLLAVLASGFFARLLPIKVPLPLVQIAVGAGLAYGFGISVPLDPEFFFLFFIPPLLFLDGWRIPKSAFFRDFRPITTLAIGLVLFTVLGMGYFIHWMIPSVPLAAAFALAAILSPTDPVAVSAIASQSPIPPRLMHILEGEALLNDASGLVCFRFALAAVITGTFSFLDASMEFLWAAGGGLLVGVLVAWLIGVANKWLVVAVGEDPGSQILISLLLPFAAYLLAEHLQVSGILAAAAAGITTHYTDMVGRRLATTRMQRRAVWDTIQMALNGVIFVILGAQIRATMDGLPMVAANMGLNNVWWLSLYVIAIGVALTVLRFLWVWSSLRFTLFKKHRDQPSKIKPSMRVLLLTACSGVRGAITLAGILTLPLLMPDGSAFPARDLLIFLAKGVILLSLLSASVALPWLSKDMKFAPEPVLGMNEGDARVAAAEAAIRHIKSICDAAPADAENSGQTEAAMRVAELYKRRLDYGLSEGEEAARIQLLAEKERELRLSAIRAERDELFKMWLHNKLDDTLHQRLLRELDLIEGALTRSVQE